ncbi:MAG TPA: hypothetical protein VI876_04655 [Dehalococcoidia bacterium]|nr:hypothetical protein [Dehalococcoidia bacterium]
MRAKARGGSLSPAQNAAAHLWFAVLLFAGLTLPTLQPFGDDDRWLGIGTVMLTVGLATWLPLRWLAPLVVLVWGVPFLVSRLARGGSEAAAVNVEALVQLAGLLFLAGGVSAMYRQLTNGRAVASETEIVPLAPAVGADDDAEAPPAAAAARRFPGLRLERRDAAALYERLSRLRQELGETQGQLASLVHNGRGH